MTTTLRDGSTTTDRRLDRLPQFDSASRGYTVQRLLSSAPAVFPARGRSWPIRPGLDQGREGQCVPHGCAHRRNSSPRRLVDPYREIPDHKDEIRLHYYEMQRRDPWAGGMYPGAQPQYEGTSVLTAMQYGKTLGWWESYWWAGAGTGDALGDAVRGITRVSGGIAGLNWYESMFDPRPSGLMNVDTSSALAGGHCLYFPGVRLKMRLPSEWVGTKTVFVGQQSWGEDAVGVADLGRPGGIVYFTEDAMGSLLERQGEMAFTVVPRLIPPR